MRRHSIATAPLADRLANHASWLLRRLSARFGAAAPDIAQESFARLSAANPAEILHPRAYLLRVAMNVARDQIRRSTARGMSYAIAIDDLSESDAIALPADQEEVVLLKQIILSMPQLYRTVFLLNRFRGMEYKDIAVLLDISVKTVEWRMSKALAHCTAQLRA